MSENESKNSDAGETKSKDAGLESFLHTPSDCERADECASGSIERLYEVFAASAKRWELIVYPSLIAFVILAAYGFYLVYSLTSDVTKVARSMYSITETMHIVANNMNTVADKMDNVSNNMIVMSKDVASINTAMKLMVANTADMNVSIKGMSASMDHVRHSMAVMNNSVSRPMQFMNSFTPW